MHLMVLLSTLQINHVLASIRRKKSMDTIILSLVGSVSAFLTFIYWLSK
jgi:golgi SNAP receptor complex member 1